MNNPERIRRGPTTSATIFFSIAFLAAACADQNAVMPPTATPASELTITPNFFTEPLADILKKMQYERALIKEFVRDFGTVAMNPTQVSDEAYAVLWAQSNKDPHRSFTYARAGLGDMLLGFDIENTYSDNAKPVESTISIHLINQFSHPKYLPTLEEYISPTYNIGVSYLSDSPGIPPKHLRAVAEYIFKLPEKLTWEVTTRDYREYGEYQANGIMKVPAMKASGRSSDGSNITFIIDSAGYATLTKTYPPLNLSFEQRFNSHRFAKNGSLKPQFAPRKLGL